MSTRQQTSLEIGIWDVFVKLPLIHQAVPLSRPRKKITVTIELCSALTGASRPEHTQGSARLYIFETSMFEHP